MFQSQEAIELVELYQSGQRNFQEFELRRSNLRELNLSNTDFRGVDLSYANLRNVDFSGADLRDAYLNEADLTGANLTGANLGKASLIKVYLIKANCYKTNFSDAYLTSAYLTNSKLQEAHFNGAYLNGAKLSGAEFTGAYYDEKTRFDNLFNPQKAQMITITSDKEMIEQPTEMTTIQQTQNDPNITVEQFLSIFNHLTEISHRYLGKTMTQKYWESSRPLCEWLDGFVITSSTEIIFQAEEELQTVLTSTNLKSCQTWVITFMENCSQIVQNYSKMVDTELVMSFISVGDSQENSQENLDDVTTVQSNKSELLSI